MLIRIVTKISFVFHSWGGCQQKIVGCNVKEVSLEQMTNHPKHDTGTQPENGDTISKSVMTQQKEEQSLKLC